MIQFDWTETPYAFAYFCKHATPEEFAMVVFGRGEGPIDNNALLGVAQRSVEQDGDI
jgi:hypothetical protein